MTFLKRRDRTVIFRLTQDEYDNLETACLRRGARTLSDYARSELLQAVERDQSEVMQELSDLRSRLERMEGLLSSVFGRHGKAKRGAA
jgi:transcriptional antiterminator Rof (Rho-off)